MACRSHIAPSAFGRPSRSLEHGCTARRREQGTPLRQHPSHVSPISNERHARRHRARRRRDSAGQRRARRSNLSQRAGRRPRARQSTAEPKQGSAVRAHRSSHAFLPAINDPRQHARSSACGRSLTCELCHHERGCRLTDGRRDSGAGLPAAHGVHPVRDHRRRPEAELAGDEGGK